MRYFELTLVDTSKDLIATAALLHCSLCGDCISGMGGPGYGAICLECGTRILESPGLAELSPSPSAE